MSSEITVQVKHLTHKNYNVNISQKATVGDLKKKLQSESGIKSQEMKIIFKGKIFKDDGEILEELKVENGSVLHMIH